MKLKGKIVLLILIPMLILGACTYAVCYQKITEVMKEEIQQSLQTSAMILDKIICVNDTEELNVKENGDLWWGDTLNITQDVTVMDEIREETGILTSVVLGDVRYATSILDESGNKILGTKASTEVSKQVLVNEQNFFAENLDIRGREYFGYYIPIYDGSSSKPVGMVFAGLDQGTVEDEISSILLMILGTIIFIAVACIIIIYFVVSKISGRIMQGVKALEQVANGNLNIEIDEKSKSASDETGEMVKAVEKLRNNLSQIVDNIKGNSDNINSFSRELDISTSETVTSISQVEIAVGEISEGAGAQADDTQKATENVIIMGAVIQETGMEVLNLHENAEFMHSSSEQANNILNDLEQISEKTKNAIDEIYIQTNTTNEAAVKIQAATNIISSIANETNLLSLNASIEAARAGDAGRGFAVVAEQIQRLADESTKSAQLIEEIVNELISDSERAVNTMDEVKEIVEEQNVKIDMTSKIFEEVKSGIDKSVLSVDVIEEKTKIMDLARSKVVDIVQNL